MLQRTRAPQAQRAFDEFRGRFPTAQALIDAAPEASALTARLGLHWRGPLLLAAAREVAAKGGRPPEDTTALRALPGVGPYAAAAWLSLHRDVRAVLVDTNVARWLCRMTGNQYTAETRRKRWLRELAAELTPQRRFRDYNYAVLDFTMQMCLPRKPRCAVCPLVALCAFGSESRVRLGAQSR